MFPNYVNCCVFKINIIISIFFGNYAETTVTTTPSQLGGTSSSTSTPTKNVTISKHPVILVVSFDGFRADYLERGATPTLNALRATGVRVPYMEPVFPTMTFPNLQSLVTGLYVEGHGIVGNSFYDPKYNKSLDGFLDDPEFWNYDPDVLPLWILNEMAGDGRTSGCKLWPGAHHPYGPQNNSLPTYHDPRYNRTVPWEDRIDSVISWMTNPSNPANLVFLYYEEPDERGHGFGPNSPEALDEIRKTDKKVAYLVNRLKDIGIFDKINLIMMGDHGSVEVTKERIINVTEIFRANSHLIKRWYGGTPYRQLTPKEGKLEELFDALKKEGDARNFAVFRTANMREPYFYSKSRRIMDLVVLANPGHAFDDFYEYMGIISKYWNFTPNETHVFGFHGYSGLYPHMQPFFLAHGPAFKKDLDHGPIKIVDIVPLITTILGIPTPPNNGSLERVVGLINPKFLPPNSGNGISSHKCIFISGIVFILRMAIV